MQTSKKNLQYFFLSARLSFSGETFALAAKAQRLVAIQKVTPNGDTISFWKDAIRWLRNGRGLFSTFVSKDDGRMVLLALGALMGKAKANVWFSF